MTIGGVILLLQTVSFTGIAALLALSHTSAGFVTWLYGALALLMGTAAFGVFKLRSWARILVLVMATYGLFMSGLGLVSTLWVGRGTGRPLFPVIAAAFWLLWIALSLWWFSILNKPSVKRQFEGAMDHTGRPLSMTIIALLLIAAPILMLISLGFGRGSPIQFSYFSRVMGVKVPPAVWLSFSFLSNCIGAGLGVGIWKLRSWARQAAICYLGITFLNMLLLAATTRLPGAPPSGINAAEWQMTAKIMPLGIIVSSTVTTVLLMWFLVAKHRSFSS